MNISTLKNTVTSKAARTLLKGQKHSPHIMFGAGVVGVVATAVLASRATLKLDDILEETNVKVSDAKGLHASGHKDYPDDVYKKDVAIIHTKSALKIAQLYGPALACGVVSIGLLTGAHVTLNRRNAGLMAAYATLQKGVNEYRDRVIAEVGEEKERELRFGVDSRDVFEEAEDGEPKIRALKSPSGHSMYARFFSPDSTEWNPTPEYNIFFLRSIQNQLNDRLTARGHVFLNEAYDDLGLPRTKEGAVVGWVKNGVGDGYIDLGIWADNQMAQMHEFMTGREDCILLDFNVDGVIYNQI